MLLYTTVFSVAFFGITWASCPFSSANIEYFATFSGERISNAEYQEMVKKNTSFFCAIDVAPCDPNEGRRVDGTCNNLNHPTRGGRNTPFTRLLPASYGKSGVIIYARLLETAGCGAPKIKNKWRALGKAYVQQWINTDYQPRPTKSGKARSLARYKRTRLVLPGKVPDQHFTQLLTYFLVFVVGDIISIEDTINYVIWKTHCCTPQGASDPECAPNYIPIDDPTFRYTDIKCLNMTRPVSYQFKGCLPNNTMPRWISTNTPSIDLSHVYGETVPDLMSKGRKLEGGLMKYEVDDNGIVWPPSVKSEQTLCYLNQKPHETRCHATPIDGTNSLLGINLFSIWFWRMHNVVANELRARNPGWDDDKLFYTARDINTAIYHQLLYKELMAQWMGEDNLVASGVISDNPGFRDEYDENVIPQLSVESVYALRWLHLLQSSSLKFYDASGNYLKEQPMVNMTLRTGYLAIDDNLRGITQGSFRQPCGGADNIADPDMLTIGLGPLQKVTDIVTNDLSKDGYFGFQPYIKYREYCSGKSYKTFKDLRRDIPNEWVEVHQDIYEHVEDVELMAGIWSEKPMKGSYVPPTFYCLVADQLKRNMVSDRHWFERPNRPNAFTLEQLQEIRKMTMARFMCDVGDSVTEIQPNAFFRAGKSNEMQSCENIPKMNFDAWTDPSACGVAE